ncbi:hypothetical protein EJB05_14725, partial [Eragrostis curvula]
METPTEYVKRFFLILERVMLARIEVLVFVIALLYLLMFILDLWRRRSHSSAIKFILLILDAIADSTFLYTMGQMQSAPFKKDLFPVWALVLVNLRFSGCFISAYGMPDQENRRMSELSTVMAFSTVAFLNGTRNSQFRYPIWAMWVLQLVRSVYLIMAYNLAIQSSLHGRSSAFLTVCSAALNHADEAPVVNSTTMAGYGYPVCGDQLLKFQVKAPKYNFHLSTDHKTGLTTLETVWNDRTLKNLSSSKNTDVKLIRDMCMSFSMYRLLRCRFDNFSLPSNTIKEIRDLMSTIMKDGPERTFRIVESEVAFINDYFYTRYPVLFFRGFPLPATLHPLATIVLTCWLGRDIQRSYKPNKPGETAHLIHGVNVDLIITWVFMGVVVLQEFWKMLTYLLSDWTKVTVLCQFIPKDSELQSKWLKWLIQNLVWLLCTPRFKIVKRWHWKINQYEFIQSYVYNPWKSNLFFYLSLGIFPKHAKGVKVGKTIKLPEEVKAAILKSICSMDLEKEFLKGDDLPSLNKARMEIRSEIKWAFKLSTCTHTILVWHIATSMCEIELAQHYNTSLTDSEVLRALKSAKGCCSSSQPYIIKLQRLEYAIRANFSVANSISRYCAYMIAKVPDLLPDSSFVPELILESTVEEASKILEGCDNLQSIYRRLMREGQMKGNEGGNGRDGNRDTNRSDAVIDVGVDEDHNLTAGDGDDTDDVVPSQERIITKGAQLGRLLIEKISDDVARWKLLSEVWADLLVHIAPSWNTDAHKKHLATGGEFITHVWAILSHCGIESSKLWPEEVPEDGQLGATGREQDTVQQQSVPPTARRPSTANQEKMPSNNSLGRAQQNQSTGQSQMRKPDNFQRSERTEDDQTDLQEDLTGVTNEEIKTSAEKSNRETSTANTNITKVVRPDSRREGRPLQDPEQRITKNVQVININKPEVLPEEIDVSESIKSTSTDYMVSNEDLPTIEYIKSSSPEKILVDYGEYKLNRQRMECLLDPKAYINSETANVCIRLLREKCTINDREDGSVYLETTYNSKILWRDAESEIEEKDKHHHSFIIERAQTYLKHDMVFLPINIEEKHWYVGVVNARKHEIQVLDSLNYELGDDDLVRTLKGLERHFDQVKKLESFKPGEKWKDTQVTKWQIRRPITHRMQFDGMSCGLFMIKFFECWTGNTLSPTFAQNDITNLRCKLAVISVNDPLNKEKGSPGYKITNTDKPNSEDKDI